MPIIGLKALLTSYLSYALRIHSTSLINTYYWPHGPNIRHPRTTPDVLTYHSQRLTPPKPLWTPMDAQAQAQQAGRNAQPLAQDYAMSCYLLCLVFCHSCYPISPDQDHKPRGRASDVSTISSCFSLCHDLLPTPPPISVRKAGGTTVVYLCGF